MDTSEIHTHWEALAQRHGVDLLSTTKTPTIKRLEIASLSRAMKAYFSAALEGDVLEVGCGNGYNVLALAQMFPACNFDGVDYSEQMIAAAEQLASSYEGYADINFYVGDVSKLDHDDHLKAEYDLVFTDRLIINLNTWDAQRHALRILSSRVAANGLLMILENFTGPYREQNALRQALGLEPRTPDPYNRFIDEEAFESFMQEELGLDLLCVDNFGSLHDIVLYVLLPAINDGVVQYDHPLMDQVARLLEDMPESSVNAFGAYGQNRLYVFRKFN